MILKEIDTELKEAMRQKDSNKVNGLRLIKNAIQNVAINQRRDLTKEETIAVLQKEAKKRKEAISQFEAGQRLDLASKEKQELKLLEKYLPQAASLEEIEKAIDQTIAALNVVDEKGIGLVISQVIKKLAGRAPGADVARLVKEKLER